MAFFLSRDSGRRAWKLLIVSMLLLSGMRACIRVSFEESLYVGRYSMEVIMFFPSLLKTMPCPMNLGQTEFFSSCGDGPKPATYEASCASSWALNLSLVADYYERYLACNGFIRIDYNVVARTDGRAELDSRVYQWRECEAARSDGITEWKCSQPLVEVRLRAAPNGSAVNMVVY